jgi:hypothetical protein
MISPDYLEDAHKLTEALAKEIPFRLLAKNTISANS